MNYKPTIGLEIHIELKTKSKLFCACRNNPDETKPNANICPICMGHPGVLPVINKEAVKKIVKTALALNCEIAKSSEFYRKLYFYPDLPKGYQISQDISPLAKNGFIKIDGKKVRVHEIHLEEDVAKLVHPQGEDYSLVDFNRAGIPLIELVTEPDINSTLVARKFAQELQLILRYLDVSDADMEKGQMRVEVNVSLSPEHSKKLGTKVEIKNLNSFRAVNEATNFEIARQKKLLEENKKVVPETMGWDDEKRMTFSQREKGGGAFSTEDFHAPEPNLFPLRLIDTYIEKIRSEIPELPSQRKKRFKKEYQLPEREIELYISQKDLGEYFEKVVSELNNWVKAKKMEEKVSGTEFKKLVKLASNYISTDLQGLLAGSSVADKDFLITSENFAEFVSMIYLGEISSKIAKTLLKEMFSAGKDPSQIIEEKGLQQITDEKKLEKIVKEVIAKNPKPVEDYKKGKESALQFLVGQVMAQTKGKANPEMVNKILGKLLS